MICGLDGFINILFTFFLLVSVSWFEIRDENSAINGIINAVEL